MIKPAAFIFVIGAVAVPAHAQTPSTPAANVFFQSCEKERANFCSDKKTGGEIGECLAPHVKELSTDCLQDFQKFLQFRKQAAARGGGALSAFGGLNAMGAPVPLVSYDGRFSPGTNEVTGVVENKANLSVPVYRNGANSFAVSLAGSTLHTGRPVVLDNGANVPMDLYRAEIGAQVFHDLGEKKNWSLRSSLGYAGDKPFANANEITYSLNLNYGFPGSGNGYWLTFIYYSNNSPLGIDFPIPGVGYLYRSEKLVGLIGFPLLAIQWTPIFPWTYSLSLFGSSLQAEAGYGTPDRAQFFAEYAFTNQKYLPSVRPNDKDRLTLQEMKTGLGLRTPIIKSVLGEALISRAIHRSFFIGPGVFNHDDGFMGLADDWSFTWSAKAAF